MAAVTTREVAHAAGVSLGVVHYCFENKDALMTALVTALSARLREVVRAASTDPAEVGTGIPALRGAIRAGLTQLWRDITAARSRQLLGFETVTWELRVTGDALDRSSLAREQYATNGVALAQLLDRLAASSGTSFTLPVATLSRSVSAMLDGLVLRWLVDGDATAAAEQLDLLADTLAGLARQS